MFSAKKNQADRVSGMNILGDHLDLLDRTFKSRGIAVTVLHAVRHIQPNDDTRAALTEPGGKALDLIHCRLRKGKYKQQDCQAAKHKQQNMLQTDLPGANAHGSIEKLHGCPRCLLVLVLVEQVSQDW
jgi:hypothetical protein